MEKRSERRNGKGRRRREKRQRDEMKRVGGDGRSGKSRLYSGCAQRRCRPSAGVVRAWLIMFQRQMRCNEQTARQYKASLQITFQRQMRCNEKPMKPQERRAGLIILPHLSLKSLFYGFKYYSLCVAINIYEYVLITLSISYRYTNTNYGSTFQRENTVRRWGREEDFRNEK